MRLCVLVDFQVPSRHSEAHVRFRPLEAIMCLEIQLALVWFELLGSRGPRIEPRLVSSGF